MTYKPLTKKDVEDFRKAADRAIEKHARSPEAARAFLVKLGVVTKSGRLTKNYSR